MHIFVALKTTLGTTLMIIQSQKLKMIKSNMKYKRCSEETAESQVLQLTCFNIVALIQILNNKTYLMT